MEDDFEALLEEIAFLNAKKAAEARATAAAARVAALPALIPAKAKFPVKRPVSKPAPPQPEETSAAIDGLMAKAMTLFEQGKCTALDIAKLENRAEMMRFQAFAQARRGERC